MTCLIDSEILHASLHVAFGVATINTMRINSTLILSLEMTVRADLELKAIHSGRIMNTPQRLSSLMIYI